MARQARVISETGVYAVILRGITDIFKEENMRNTFHECSKKYFDDGLLGIRFYDNCVHMLVIESEDGISKDMKPLVTSFARTYNRETGNTGKVFADRFKSVPVEDNALEDECIKYLNGDADMADPYKPARRQPSATDKKVDKKKTEKIIIEKKKSEQKAAVPAEQKKEPVKENKPKRNTMPTWLL